jgi:hypothetical protein
MRQHFTCNTRKAEASWQTYVVKHNWIIAMVKRAEVTTHTETTLLIISALI